MKFSYLALFVVLLGLHGCATKGGTPSATLLQSGSIAAATNQPAPVPQPASTGVGTLVIKPITFKNDSYIRDAVKQECMLEEKLSQFIKENAAGQYAAIVSNANSAPADAQVLAVEIAEVQGTGGGAWSGAKMVLITGSLTKNGQVLGTFKARRYSSGGMFAAYKGTCAILGRCVKTLGHDVAEWLSHPTSQAVLGDL